MTSCISNQFIYSFGVCHLKMDRNGATTLTSIFWLSFTIFRFLSVIQSRFLSPKVMLWMSLVGCASTMLAMSFTGNITVVYCCVAIFGASMSNCFATGFLYAQHFCEVTGKLASIFVFGGALGWSCIPALTGFIIEG